MPARRLGPLGLVVLLGGCTLAWPVTVPAQPADPPPRALAHRLELGFSREGQPVVAPDAWRDALRDELLNLGTADPAVVATPTTLVLNVDRSLETGVPSLLLNLVTLFVWPHEQDLRLTLTGTLLGAWPERSEVAEATLRLRTSSAFLLYPPAWRGLETGKLEQPEVLDALRVCLRRVLAALGAPPLQPPETVPPPGPPTALPPPPAGTPPDVPSPSPVAPLPDSPQLSPRDCPHCGRTSEREWIVCPWCGTSLPPG